MTPNKSFKKGVFFLQFFVWVFLQGRYIHSVFGKVIYCNIGIHDKENWILHLHNMDSALQGNSLEQMMCIAATLVVHSNFLINTLRICELVWTCVEVPLLMRGYEDLCGYEEMLIWGYEDHASNVVGIWLGHVATLKTGWDRVGILSSSQGGQGDILEVAAQRGPSILAMDSRGKDHAMRVKWWWKGIRRIREEKNINIWKLTWISEFQVETLIPGLTHKIFCNRWPKELIKLA